MKLEENINEGFIFVDIHNLQDSKSCVDGQIISFSIIISNGGKVIFIIGTRLDEKGAVGLISSILTVREVVTDQLGVNTGSVITTEVTRLLHFTVKVEVEISTTLLLEIPAVFSQRNDCRLVCEGK